MVEVEDIFELAELDGDALDEELKTWTHQDVRDFCDKLSDHCDDYQGVPVPLGSVSLVVQPRHPMAEFFNETPGYQRECNVDDVREDERIVNEWFDRKRNRYVYVMDRGGKRSAVVVPAAPDRSMQRLNLWIATLHGVDAWNLEAEYKAREHLKDMLNEHQWNQYELTGSFLESSERSGLTYLFRKSRPTVVLTPRGKDPDVDQMWCLAVLCLHPIGYYHGSWAGCMVPTDDVIAHLSLMRADEAMFWGKSVQHRPDEPEAGL